MKVLHVITGLSTGGAERALYNLLQGGLSKRFSSHVVSLGDAGTLGPQIEALGVPVITLGMRAGRPSLKGMIRLRQAVREFQPDLIQGWMYHGNLAASLAQKLSLNHPMLVWNVRHCLYDLGYEKLMSRQVIRANRFFSFSPDAVLYNSRLSRKQHETFGFSSIRGKVVPNGIDVHSFCYSSEARKRVRSELEIPGGALVVGHVARLHPMKDHPLFLRAAVDLANRYPEVHFLLSGRGVSLDNAEIAQLIPAHAVRDRFHLLGERSDVSNLMSAMDVFCQSSWSEAFPNVLGEAMATGIPCIATDAGDSALIVGDTGLVVPPRSEVELVNGIESLLLKSAEERRSLGDAARAKIETNYALGEIVDQYATLYETLIIEKGVG